LKRTGIVVGILWGIFLLIVIFFAIKARLQQNNDEEAQQ
jgi:high-affinity Fe2+/Pb2+ permease